MSNNTLPTSFTRLMQVLAAISIVPALFLPFYQAFLHGGRGAVDIIPRSGTYALVHMLGAFCVLFAMFGLIALYLRYHDHMGRIAPLCFILSILAQAFFAGLLFIDGFFMPTLAHFDPATQTLLHSADYFNIVGQHPASLEPVGAAIYVPVLIGIVYLIANVLLGIVILRKRFLPMPVGVVFIVGGLILGAGTSVPIWIEVIGYAAEGLAIAWSAYLIASGSSSNGAGATRSRETVGTRGKPGKAM